MHTVVIGGGVIGLATAYELAAGGDRVSVVDAAHFGAAASAGNAGWVTPFLSMPRAAPGAMGEAITSMVRRDPPAKLTPRVSPDFIDWGLRFAQASTKKYNARSVQALQALAARALSDFDSLEERGVQFEQHRTGLAVAFQNKANLEAYLPTVERMRSFGYRGEVEIFRDGEVQEFDPALHSRVRGVMHLVDERHIRPDSLTNGLVAALRLRGAELVANDGVRSIHRAVGNAWVVLTEAGREIAADRVVVAAGAESRRILAPLRVKVPIEVAKGVSITASGDGLVPRQALKLYEHMVACSPFNDSLRLSGTFDIGARGSDIDSRRLAMVLRQGRSYLKDWTPTKVEQRWAGHRPTSADDTPIVGKIPGHDELYIASGHGTLGITLAPTTGALLAREILENEKQALLEPFRITRF